jgi:hypothetical protein
MSSWLKSIWLNLPWIISYLWKDLNLSLNSIPQTELKILWINHLGLEIPNHLIWIQIPFCSDLNLWTKVQILICKKVQTLVWIKNPFELFEFLQIHQPKFENPFYSSFSLSAQSACLAWPSSPFPTPRWPSHLDRPFGPLDLDDPVGRHNDGSHWPLASLLFMFCLHKSVLGNC